MRRRDWRGLLEPYLQSIHQTIDIFAAVLLLTGQITIRSVILTTGGHFSLSVTGPILGGARVEAVSEVPGAAVVIDSLDILVALLLIIGQLEITGLFIYSQRFNVVVNGPAFGTAPLGTYVPSTAEFFTGLKDQLLDKYGSQSR